MLKNIPTIKTIIKLRRTISVQLVCLHHWHEGESCFPVLRCFVKEMMRHNQHQHTEYNLLPANVFMLSKTPEQETETNYQTASVVLGLFSPSETHIDKSIKNWWRTCLLKTREYTGFGHSCCGKVFLSSATQQWHTWKCKVLKRIHRLQPDIYTRMLCDVSQLWRTTWKRWSSSPRCSSWGAWSPYWPCA